MDEGDEVNDREHLASDQVVRPAIVSDDHLTYLDELRESGDTNMFGAGPYLREEFPELTRSQSHAILEYWMETFPERHPPVGKNTAQSTGEQK